MSRPRRCVFLCLLVIILFTAVALAGDKMGAAPLPAIVVDGDRDYQLTNKHFL